MRVIGRKRRVKESVCERKSESEREKEERGIERGIETEIITYLLQQTVPDTWFPAKSFFAYIELRGGFG